MNDTSDPKILITVPDESPALAMAGWFPAFVAFVQTAGVQVGTMNISLAHRILAAFYDRLTPYQQAEVNDDLAELGLIVKTPEAIVVKLPNISASVPQLNDAIRELQGKGYNVPDYPEDPKSEGESEIQSRYKKVIGSVVNPVLREGNSERRASEAVAEYAHDNPHAMGLWSADSKTYVASMTYGDFYGSEVACVSDVDQKVRIEHVDEDGEVTVLKDDVQLTVGELADCSAMSIDALYDFLMEVKEEAKRREILFSVHLKATMMKVSDPIIFGAAVRVFFSEVFKKHSATFKGLGVNPNNGLADLIAKVELLPDVFVAQQSACFGGLGMDLRPDIEALLRANGEMKRDVILADIQDVFQDGPAMAMVDSDRGITNLHVPSDVIIDASMPAAIKSSGKMWGPDGTLQDAVMTIPCRSYAGVYQTVIDYCKRCGAFDPRTMGSVWNLGLMAQKAQEYGSHDKTFQAAKAGIIRVVAADGTVLMEQQVKAGDIFRMSQTKDLPINNWVKLAVGHARKTGFKTIFWLDPNRAHDCELRKKVRGYITQHGGDDLVANGTIKIMSPTDACLTTCELVTAGETVISVTGNVLRDYLTDLFPILQLNTSAKMLSIVSLLEGGWLYETGAGGSAPKHVAQFHEEGHLRWDSLGSFQSLPLALASYGNLVSNAQAAVLSSTMEVAVARYLKEGKSPERKVRQRDNRESTYWLFRFWAEALAAQDDDADLKSKFESIAAELVEKEATILAEFLEAQGGAVDLGGYYLPDPKKVEAVMCCSASFNDIIASLTA